MTVSVADPKALGDNKLVVTYAYRLGSRSKSFEQMYDEDKEIAKAHDATWDDTVTCVQKTFARQRLAGEVRDRLPDAQGPVPGVSADALRAARGARAGSVAGGGARASLHAQGRAERRAGHAAEPVADRHATSAGRAREAHDERRAARPEGRLRDEEGRGVPAPVRQVAEGQLRRLGHAGRLRRRQAAQARTTWPRPSSCCTSRRPTTRPRCRSRP